MRTCFKNMAWVVVAMASYLPASAHAQPKVYQTTNFNHLPVLASDEIKPTWQNVSPMGTAATLIAAGMMGAQFYGNSNVTGTQQALKSKCVTLSNAGNTWPEGCDLKVAPSMLFCKKHWAMCPKPQQRTIWATYRKGQEITKTPSREYLAAFREAVEAVAKLEGRR